MNKVIKKLMFTFAFAFGALAMVSCGEHQHKLAKDWSSDATKHWHECDGCDEKVDKAAHEWGNWIVDTAATETSKGSQHRVCSVCNYRADEIIPIVVEPGVATELTAVYAQVPAEWEEDVNIYYWGDAIEDGYGVGWPGVPMTLVNAEEHIWGYKVPAGTDHVIFNWNGVQTVDLDFIPAKNLYILQPGDGNLTAENADYVPTANDPELGQPEYNVIERLTIYAQVPAEWEVPSIHYWGTATGDTSWPGAAMTEVDAEEHVYSYNVPADIGGFCLTNGAADGTIQTVDLKLYDNANAYVLTEANGEGKFEADVKNYEDGEFKDVEVVEALPVFYVMGSMNGWSANDDYKLAYDEATDVATIEVELAVGDEFKVADPSWNPQFAFGSLEDTTGFEDNGGNIKVAVAGTYVITVTDVSVKASRACTIVLKVSE